MGGGMDLFPKKFKGGFVNLIVERVACPGALHALAAWVASANLNAYQELESTWTKCLTTYRRHAHIEELKGNSGTPKKNTGKCRKS